MDVEGLRSLMVRKSHTSYPPLTLNRSAAPGLVSCVCQRGVRAARSSRMRYGPAQRAQTRAHT